MKNLRNSETIAQIENNTKFIYSIGDGDNIGGELGNLEEPVYINMLEDGEGYTITNNNGVELDWSNPESVMNHFLNQESMIYTTIEEVIDALNAINC